MTNEIAKNQNIRIRVVALDEARSLEMNPASSSQRIDIDGENSVVRIPVKIRLNERPIIAEWEHPARASAAQRANGQLSSATVAAAQSLAATGTGRSHGTAGDPVASQHAEKELHIENFHPATIVNSEPRRETDTNSKPTLIRFDGRMPDDQYSLLRSPAAMPELPCDNETGEIIQLRIDLELLAFPSEGDALPIAIPRDRIKGLLVNKLHLLKRWELVVLGISIGFIVTLVALAIKAANLTVLAIIATSILSHPKVHTRA